MEIQWTLILFTVISGTGAWLFASSAAGEILKKEANPSKVEAIIAFILLVIGGCMSVLHLKHPDRILEALNRPTSGIFIEAALIGIICAVLAVYFIMVVRKSSPKARMIVAGVALVLCIVFTYACGSSYMMDARPAWTTIALPLSYLGTAAAAGTALNLLVKIVLKRTAESIRFAAVLSLAGSILGLVASAYFCFASGADLFSPEHNLIVWVIALFVTLVIAGVCSAVVMRHAEKGMVLAVVALVAAVVSAIAVRVVMWLIGTPIMDLFLMPLE